MRIRLTRFLLVLVLCWAMLVFPAGAEETTPANAEKEQAIDIKNTNVTDSLSQIDSVRWYQFTLENTADAVVRFTTDFVGDEYYYWQVTVYHSQKEFPISNKGIGCGSVRDNDLLLGNLELGTYYVKVQSRHEGSPGSSKASYTDSPYSIQVITEGYTHPTGEAQRTKVSTAGEIIAVIGGKVYIKRNDGEAYVACYVTGKESGPILLGESEDAVEYYTPFITDRMISGFEKLEWEGKTYYYRTSIRDGYEGTASDASLYLCCEGRGVTGEVAANDLLKLHFGVSPLEEEEKEKEAEDKKGTFWACVVIAAILVFGVVELFVIKKHSNRSHSSSSGYSTSSNWGPTEKDLRDMEDMQIIRGINNNLHTPGYEADGPSRGPGPEDPSTGPGTEDFPPPGSIW